VSTVGRACLFLALAISLYGVAASLYGARAGAERWIASGRRAIYALAGVLLVAFAILETAFLRSDLNYALVASHSSTTTPTFYRATAMWSSQEGSLLLWVTLLAGWSALAFALLRRRLRDVAPYAAAVLLAMAAFFSSLLVFLEDPFTQLPVAAAEGAGLNPLLRHPGMMVHPPMLYSGYTLFAIPFAFAVGALWVRRSGHEWIAQTRRFSLAAWFCLGVGILLGARWSYSELGWGGYWAWDPVENASLMPWLTGTAFLHSVMIQEKRGMLKVWNASLVLATGVLCLLGTFLVRSGILDSIHAFGASTLGVPFVVLLIVMSVGSVWLVASRRDTLRSEHRLDSLVSRESAFLANNLVLVGLCFVVFWGTFFPLISEAVTGTKAAVGPPWFDRYTVPLALLLVLLSGIGPALAWRRATPSGMRRHFTWPAGAAVLTVVALAAFGVSGSWLAIAMFAFGAFVLAAIGQEWVRGVGARRAMASESLPVAAARMVGRNRRRWGGYIIHAGITVMFVGVAASSSFQAERDIRMQPGDTATVGGYTVKYERATADVALRNDRVEKITLGADLRVSRDGRDLGPLHTERGYYPSSDPSLGPVGRYFEGESTSEIGLMAGPWRDLWTAVAPDQEGIGRVVSALDRRLADASPEQAFAAAAGFAQVYRAQPPPATFRVISSPLVTWIWIGAIVVFAGGLIALWPAPDAARRRARAGYAARVARDLGRA
jgi:cytochrome c-type biogenesis protein CcmF